MLFYLLLLLSYADIIWAQSPNGVVGDPLLHCAGDYFEIRFETQNPFLGLVFVKDRLNDPRCRSSPVIPTGARSASLRLGFNDCDVQRRTSTTPRGLFVSTELILAFSPDYLTKYDKIYKVQCFYMEMDRKIIKEVEVSMPPPTLQTKQVPMPVCKYEVLEGSPTGPPIHFATVGQMVYHKWTCEAEQQNTFCMTVHSCFVDDGNGDRVQLINEQGCALDKYLLTNLEYPTDLMAGREAHVYKYADRDNMYFDCQITLRIKEPGAEYCEIPNCPDPPRRRRSNVPETDGPSNSTDYDYQEDFIIPMDAVATPSWLNKNFLVNQIGLCMSAEGVYSILFPHLLLLLLTILVIRSSYKIVPKEY